MKKILSILFKGKIILIVLSIVGALTGFLLAFQFCKDTAILRFRFRYVEDVSISTQDIISNEAIEKTKAIEYSWYTGSSTSTYKNVNISLIEIKELEGYYEIIVDKEAFIIDGAYKAATARGFMKHLVISNLDQSYYENYESRNQYLHNDKYNYDYTILGITEIFDNEFYENNSLNESGNLIEDTNNHKLKMEILFTSIGLISGLLISIITVLILGFKFEIKKIEYNNETIYKYPFHIKIFKSSINSLKNIRTYITIALLLSFVMLFKFIPIPSGFGSLGITFGFLFLSIACMIYGPIPALIIGALSDLIGFVIRPTGPFFPGYTLDAMLACFTYALCFYKTHITFTRCLIARTIVNLFVNTILGSIWNGIITGLSAKALGTYILITSLPKNIAYLLPQSIILFIVLKAVTPVLKAIGQIDEDVAVTIF